MPVEKGITVFTINTKMKLTDEFIEKFRSYPVSDVYNYILSCSNNPPTLDDMKHHLATIKDRISNVISFLKNSNLINSYLITDVGYIYVITDSYENFKIGSTLNMNQRMKVYQTSIPYLSTVKTIKLQWYKEYELLLHEKFKDKHIKGEWFKLTSEDIESI